MLVYRLSSLEEINELFDSKNISNICKTFTPSKKKNNFKYDPNKRYIHFFKDFESTFYLNLDKDKYICVYDIPELTLERNKGMGIYLDREFMNKIDMVREYAIPSEEMDYSYLKSVHRILEYIDYCDYLEDNYIDKIEKIKLPKVKKLRLLK